MRDDQKNPLPIKIDSTSNGEFVPVPDTGFLAQTKDAAHADITRNARRVGLARRRFLTSVCGAATTLLTFNAAQAAIGNVGGVFDLDKDTAFDPELAQSRLGGDAFIFDIQTHMVDPDGPWRQTQARAPMERFLSWLPQGACGSQDPVDCFDAAHFVKEVFLNSDTDMAVLSFVPAPERFNPLSKKEAARTRALVQALDGTDRLLLHAMVLPNLPPHRHQLDQMAAAARNWKIAAWKVYTQWGPRGKGWALDDPKIGIPFIEQARALGIKTICIHKGLPLRRMGPDFANCEDIGRAARRFPDVNFIIYHSGFEIGRREGFYNPRNAGRGVDSLVKSLVDNGIKPNSNVYAELGTTWRYVMRDPTSAAHTLGKLLRYVGEDRVLWGTDSIWYGSPQDQIQAFRSFQIAPAIAEKGGYPMLTPTLKAKIFGLSGAAAYGVDPKQFRKKAENDAIERMRRAALDGNAPTFDTYGPRTTAQFDTLERLRGPYPD